MRCLGHLKNALSLSNKTGEEGRKGREIPWVLVLMGGCWSTLVFPFPVWFLSLFSIAVNAELLICPCLLCVFQDVKVFSEDGTSKVVEILADMTARDLCQLLVYKSHCVDDNSWTLVEHHPHLGLGREWGPGPCNQTKMSLPNAKWVATLSPAKLAGSLCAALHPTCLFSFKSKFHFAFLPALFPVVLWQCCLGWLKQ
jgi:hypothetical protein